jgi:hypothetical protein
MKEVCQLTFKTSFGKNRVMSIAGPRPGLAQSTVGSAASMIMSANPFDAEIGELVKLERAQHVLVTRKTVIENVA